MTGRRQENWLLSGRNRAIARWHVLAQQTIFAQFNFGNTQFLPGNFFNPDQWDRGYVRCTVTPDIRQTDYCTVATFAAPTSGAQTLAFLCG